MSLWTQRVARWPLFFASRLSCNSLGSLLEGWCELKGCPLDAYRALYVKVEMFVQVGKDLVHSVSSGALPRCVWTKCEWASAQRARSCRPVHGCSQHSNICQGQCGERVSSRAASTAWSGMVARVGMQIDATYLGSFKVLAIAVGCCGMQKDQGSGSQPVWVLSLAPLFSSLVWVWGIPLCHLLFPFC